MIKIGQIGAGRMGTVHAANAAASRRLDLAVIADRSEAAAERLAGEVDARAGTIEEILEDGDIRGVIVASSTDSHLDNSLACLRAGKTVFCEKPLSLSPDRLAEALPELASLPPLFVAFNRRFDTHIRALKDKLDAGSIGRLETLHLINHDPAAPSLDFVPASGGLFKDFTIHDFDMAQWLTSGAIVEVMAWASCLVDPRIAELGDVDTAKILVRTDAGEIVMISNSRRSGYGYDQRIEAFGSKGSLRVENVARDEALQMTEAGPAGAPIHFSFRERYADAYRAEMDHFADIIEGKAAPSTGGADALRALRLAEAAKQSLTSGEPTRLTEQADA
jgi:myo-inositol 2-dehydrogenase / D-chiro-inositol 1-dehydrogenase